VPQVYLTEFVLPLSIRKPLNIPIDKILLSRKLPPETVKQHKFV